MDRSLCVERARRSPGAASDYHDVLLHQLRALESELKERFGANASMRCYVDTGPLAERAYAARAGVGWIGKNTCVLNQQQGSWLLLGVIVTSLELEPEAWSVPAADRCGSCTRCIDACPTDALLDPEPGGVRQMDATRCIAYLTIEKKGSIAEELRPLMGRQVFGCDICQDVCPWNRRAPVADVGPAASAAGAGQPGAPVAGGAWTGRRSIASFAARRWSARGASESCATWRLRWGTAASGSFCPQLEAWVAGDDAVLAEAAAWAADRLRE